MKAIVISEYGGPEKLVIQDLPVARPGSEQVLVEVKAFGVNRAETYMRKGAWGEVAKVSGIECVGVVKEDPSGSFATGQKVTALMGGLGRTINGSYAEFTCDLCASEQCGSSKQFARLGRTRGGARVLFDCLDLLAR